MKSSEKEPAKTVTNRGLGKYYNRSKSHGTLTLRESSDFPVEMEFAEVDF